MAPAKQCRKYATSVDIQKQSLIQNHKQQEYSESAREQRIVLYKSNQQHQHDVGYHCDRAGHSMLLVSCEAGQVWQKTVPKTVFGFQTIKY